MFSQQDCKVLSIGCALIVAIILFAVGLIVGALIF